MPTLYMRRVNLKDALSDAEVVAYWKFVQEEFVPAALKVQGMRSAKIYSGAGDSGRILSRCLKWMMLESTSA